MLLESKWFDWGIYGVFPRTWYRSFPLGAPLLNTLQWDEQCKDGLYLISPRGSAVWNPGPVVLDGKGSLVWAEDKFGQITNFKIQRYRGHDYLTFWAGKDGAGHTYGTGIYYMLDNNYEVFKTIQPEGDLKGDLHEFAITDEGTALVTMYTPLAVDLSVLNGPKQGWILDGLFQEIDIETGDMIFEWRASDHFSLDSTRLPLKGGQSSNLPFDFFHINSVDKDEDGNYYVSSRHTHTITSIDPSGTTRWTLGGKDSSFTDLSNGTASNFMWQHDARMHSNSLLTLFDNGAAEGNKKFNSHRSRAMSISLDLESMTATLVSEYANPSGKRMLARSQGSAQVLPNTGNVLIGWGFLPAFTEFTAAGEVVCDAHFAPSIIWGIGAVTSYRTFKATEPWIGQPSTLPDVHLKASDKQLYVSWNGATEVDHWILQGVDYSGLQYEDFINLTTSAREDFETAFDVDDNMPDYLRVAAISRNGQILRYSELVDRKLGNATSSQWYDVVAPIVFAISVLLTFWFYRRRVLRVFGVTMRKLGIRLSKVRRSADNKARDEAELEPLYAD